MEGAGCADVDEARHQVWQEEPGHLPHDRQYLLVEEQLIPSCGNGGERWGLADQEGKLARWRVSCCCQRGMSGGCQVRAINNPRSYLKLWPVLYWGPGHQARLQAGVWHLPHYMEIRSLPWEDILLQCTFIGEHTSRRLRHIYKTKTQIIGAGMKSHSIHCECQTAIVRLFAQVAWPLFKRLSRRVNFWLFFTGY